MFAANVLFFFSRLSLNPLVILTFWRIELKWNDVILPEVFNLSSCNLLAALTNYPLIALLAVSFLTGKLDINARRMLHSLSQLTNVCNLSFFTPSFVHEFWSVFDVWRHSILYLSSNVTDAKGILLTLLAILIITELTFELLFLNDIIQFPPKFTLFYYLHSSNVVHQLL